MKFFHISDLHIGKQLHHYHMSEDQKYVLAQIVDAVRREKPDAVVIAGDIYDTPVPSAEAVSVFDTFLTALSAEEPQVPVLIIAGNHDSARRIDFASGILKKHGVHIAGMPPTGPEEFIKKVALEDEWGEVIFYLLPFLKPSYVRRVFEEELESYDMAVKKLIERERIDTDVRNVIVSHQFYTAGGAAPVTSDSEVRIVGGIENVDAEALEPFDYAALGHIHRAQKIGKEIFRYSGSPLQYSVSEAGNEKAVTVVEMGKKGTEAQIYTIPLIPLRRVHKLTGCLEDILSSADERLRDDFVSITLTDEIEPYQPKERLEEFFGHILEIRIDNARTRRLLDFAEGESEDMDPCEAFIMFFEEMNGRNMTEPEIALLKTVINEEMEGLQL